MTTFIVYCHPSEDSFTKKICEYVIKGICDSGHTYELSDLYKMDFHTDMSEAEYLRDSNYRTVPDLACDVVQEQEKISRADAIVFIYPIFWTEAPAKLVGWFDRVWSYGFAYGEKSMKILDKGIVLCVAGNKRENLEQFGLLESMKKVMLGDRLFKRVKTSDFIVFDGMTKAYAENRKNKWDIFLQKAYDIAYHLCATPSTDISLEGKYFRILENSESGEVGKSTVFAYHQKEDSIWAEYSGGKIIKGFLVGSKDSNTQFSFRYQHINTEKKVKSGTCISVPHLLENGKLQLSESWQWDSGEKGTSLIEEI